VLSAYIASNDGMNWEGPGEILSWPVSIHYTFLCLSEENGEGPWGLKVRVRFEFHIKHVSRIRDSCIVALYYGLDDRVLIPGGGWEFLPSPQRLDRLWGSLSLLYNGYQGLSPWG
jgi:hypothetical protein